MKQQRLAQIAERVLRERSVSASALAEEFDVSLMTIHRDLDELAGEGLLRRFHGGAAAIRDALFEPDVSLRLRLSQGPKEEIARAAAALLEPNSSLLLDDSTSSLAVARHLPKDAAFTVATSFIECFHVLQPETNISLISLGGEYRRQTNSFGGAGYLKALEEIRVDVMFASSAGLDSGGVYHQESEVVMAKRAMLKQATTRILLMDHTKIGNHALHRIGPLSDWDMIIVDSQINTAHLEALRQASANVIVAEATEPVAPHS